LEAKNSTEVGSIFFKSLSEFDFEAASENLRKDESTTGWAESLDFFVEGLRNKGILRKGNRKSGE